MRRSGAGLERRPPETCAWGPRLWVQERVGNFLGGLASRRDEVKRRCRTVLQSRAERLPRNPPARFPKTWKCTSHLGFSLGDPDHLIAVTKGANRSKGAKGPQEWRPPDEGYWCQYATDWTEVKMEWGLTDDPDGNRGGHRDAGHL